MKLKKILALVLCVAMVLSTMSFSVFAEDSVEKVSTFEQLLTALAGDAETIVMTNDITGTANESNAYGKTGINILNGETLDGNGFTLTIEGATATWGTAISTTGGIIKNLKIDSGFRGVFVNHNSTYSELVVLENVVIDGPTYTISCDQGKNQGLRAINCTFNGWTSYAATIGEVEFINCNFGEGAGYAFCRPYAPTKFGGCNFDGGYKADPRAQMTLAHCKYDGEHITSENIGNLISSSDKVALAVAELNGTYYETLKEAIDDAAEGDTVELVDNVTENVTISKKLTLDGAEFNYTGTMTLAKANITIENVNFVKGAISKEKSVGVGGNYTIKNCNFDGQGMNSYAVNLNRTSTINIEKCTAMNYGYGFLQVPTSNDRLTVKDVTISNVNYGFKVDYSNGVTLDNVKVDAAVAGLLNSNYGKKTITIKDSDISIVGTWVRNDTTETTIVFEGENKVDEFKTDDSIDTLKLAVDAKLTAPEGLAVISDNGEYSYNVLYVYGAYVVEKVAKIEDTFYYNLQEAIADAADGDTITLNTNVTEEVVIDNKEVVIDLNGFTLSGAIKPSIGDITVKNGSIVNTNASVSAIEVNSGTLNLNNVNIESARHAVRIDGDVLAVIDGGAYTLNATSGTRHAVNVSGAANVTIKNGTFVGPKGTTMDSGSAVCVQAGATVTIEGGNFSGGKNATLGVSGTMSIKGGTFDQDPSTYLAGGFDIETTANGYYKVAEANKVVDKIKVEFVADSETEGEKVYNINLKAAGDDIINRLNSVDLTFALEQVEGEGENDFEIIASNDEVAINPVDNSKVRYEFHYNGKDGVKTDCGNVITIGQVKFTGYGKFSFAVDSAATTNVAHATKIFDNIVDTFVPDPDITAGEGELDITDNTITDVVIAVPDRNLAITVDFPNTVVDQVKAYQDMKVVISGGDLDKDITIDLGSDTVETTLDIFGKKDAKYAADFVNGSYVINVTDALTLNNAYTVTVSGAGYRTARYTVTMTEDKTLRFWNNVMDEAQFVEIGKESSKVNVTFLAGDIVKDNNINIYDLSAVVSYFGSVSTTENGYAKYDLNRDGVIDSKDVAYVLVSWNN